MRIVGKFKNEDIRLDSLHMSKTYGGFLLGPSERTMEECNAIILGDLQGKCDRMFGEGQPSLIVGKDDFDLKKSLPNIYCFAELTCISTVQDSTEHGSYLILIWFQNTEDDPFNKLPAVVSLIDWEKYARDFSY